MRLIIDCDPGIDDALAIIWALRAGLNLEAVTTVAGNTGVEQVTQNALRVLEIAGRPDIPVYAGAALPLGGELPHTSSSHGIDGLGDVAGPAPQHHARDTSASEYLATIATTAAGPVTIAALGPLTNIAAAVQTNPNFVRSVDRLVVMGGAIGAGNVTPAAEFNFWHDAVAADIVLRAGFANLDIVGLDVTSKVFMTADDRERIRYSGGVGEFVYDMTRAYFDAYWRNRHVIGAEMCDPLVIAHLLHPELLTMTPSHVEIVVGGESVGRSQTRTLDRFPHLQANCRMATDVDVDRFFERFLDEAFGADRTT